MYCTIHCVVVDGPVVDASLLHVGRCFVSKSGSRIEQHCKEQNGLSTIFRQAFIGRFFGVGSRVRGPSFLDFLSIGPEYFVSTFGVLVGYLFEYFLHTFSASQITSCAARVLVQYLFVDCSARLALFCPNLQIRSRQSLDWKVGRNGVHAMRMKKVPCLTLPLALSCRNSCWSKRRPYMTPSPRPTATRPRCEFSEMFRKAVRYAMDVPSHCTFVRGVTGAVRTGGLHTLASVRRSRFQSVQSELIQRLFKLDFKN